MEVNEKVIFVTSILGVFLIILGILFALIDSHNDYRCNNIDDIKYWNEYNCSKYCKKCESQNCLRYAKECRNDK